MIYNFDDLSFKPISIDKYTHKAGIFQVKARKYASLSFRISGAGVFDVGNKHFTVNPGDVLFIPADTPYKVEYSVSESIVVHMTDCNYSDPENITLENLGTIEARFRRLLETWYEVRSVNKAKAIIYDILERMAKDKKNAIENTAFSNCLKYIDENFCDPELSIESVCAKGFVSASGLQRSFGEYFGMSPKQYITKLRMGKALELLSEGELSIKEIAFSCGYSDEKYFSRAFRKKYGCPPSHFYKNEFV